MAMDAIHDLSYNLPPVPLSKLQSFAPITTKPPTYELQQTSDPQQVTTRTQYQCLMMEFQKERFRRFWQQQVFDIVNMSDVKEHTLPLTRIKKIMKTDPDVKMVSAETPYLFSRASELLVLDLTWRSWLHTEENNRRTLQKEDILAAVAHSSDMNFLLDVLPKEPLTAQETEGAARDIFPENDALQFPYSMMQLEFLHQPATTLDETSNLQAGGVNGLGSMDPFVVLQSLACDEVMYELSKDNTEGADIVMSLIEAPASVPYRPI